MASGSPPAKRICGGDSNGGDDVSKKDQQNRFSDFQISRVLNENIKSKMICLEGTFNGNEEKAVLIVEKTPLTKETVGDLLTKDATTDVILENDVYSTHSIFPNPRLNGLKTSLIYPATPKHIAKYSSQEMSIIHESADDYKNITEPFLEKEKFNIQWVYNILEKKTESERIVFEDTDPERGFILLPDMKWNGEQVSDLYLVAIVHRRDIPSIRHLSTQHLPLLKNILHKSTEAVAEKYNVESSKLRIYLHYQPSYYHLHVHVTHVKFEAPGSGVERAHLLSDVIDNIELMPDYYQKKSLSFCVKETDGLYKAYKSAGKLEPAASYVTE